MSESDLSWTSESYGDEWHDASDSDWESEWRCGVESDSTTDEEDGRKRPESKYCSDASGGMEGCWCEEDSGEESGGKKTSGVNNKPLHLWGKAVYDWERRKDGLQPLRWQIIGRKGQDELILGSVHPYPSDEQEPKIKLRPVVYCLGPGRWGYSAKDESGREVFFPWRVDWKRDYPKKDGWRDEEEYFRQLQSWTDVWGEERRLLQYSSISRRRKEKVRRSREELFSEWTGVHLRGRYKSNVYTFSLQPGVITFEKKLDEEPQEDDSCSQATMVRGSTRAGAFGNTDSGIKK